MSCSTLPAGHVFCARDLVEDHLELVLGQLARRPSGGSSATMDGGIGLFCAPGAVRELEEVGAGLRLAADVLGVDARWRGARGPCARDHEEGCDQSHGWHSFRPVLVSYRTGRDTSRRRHTSCWALSREAVQAPLFHREQAVHTSCARPMEQTSKRSLQSSVPPSFLSPPTAWPLPASRGPPRAAGTKGDQHEKQGVGMGPGGRGRRRPVVVRQRGRNGRGQHRGRARDLPVTTPSATSGCGPTRCACTR